MSKRYFLKRGLVFLMNRQGKTPAGRWLHGWVLRHDRTVRRIRGAGQQIELWGANLDGVLIDLAGDHHVVTVEPGAIVKDTTIRMRGHRHRLVIGAGCVITGATFSFEDTDCAITLGAGTTIEGGSLSAVEPHSFIRIGADCMLSHDIDIRTTDSHSIIDADTGERLNPPGNVVLEEHVWIGAYVQVLKGVTIGAHSIVGIRSLVTKDLPGHVVAVGVPARVVRERVSWKRERT